MFFNRQSAYLCLWVQALLPLLFLYSHEADLIQGLLKKNEKKLTRSFNFTFRYIDDVLSLNNSRFGDFVEGRLRTKLYDKRDDFNFPIVNFHLYVATFQQHLHMDQSIRYSRACGSYQDFLYRGLLLIRKLLG